MPHSSPSRPLAGLGAGFSCFLLWGALPLYFHLIGSEVSAWEILLQRMIWAAALLTLFIVATGRMGPVRQALGQRPLVLTLTVTALLISCNWGTFIWGVTHQHIVQTSLGYYINPLLNVILGLVFFKERLRPMQIVAIMLAAVGVMIMIIGFGKVPWISLILAASFGLYGMLRKKLDVDSITGLYIETMLLLPFALLWLGYLYQQGSAAFLLQDRLTDTLLIGCGLVTIIPLVLFTMAAHRLKLSTLGLIQYITPTLQLLTGVLIFGEAFTHDNAITFAFIWAGLMLYTFDMLYANRHTGRKAPAQ